MPPNPTLDLGALDILDILPVLAALVCGFAARLARLPPMVGFLAAGFVLAAFGFRNSPGLETIADLGVSLMLFGIGLKLNLRELTSPVIWAAASLHMLAITALGSALLWLLPAGLGLAPFPELTRAQTALLGFALSFSSTVFAVKVFEERGEGGALHARIAIGILIVQDLFAVTFLAASAGKAPSPWALALLALVPARSLLLGLLERAGHGEMLVLLGWLLPLGGAGLFELVGVKGDLGALLLGALIAGTPKSDELARALSSFKDLFLVGFFLTIGLTGLPTWGQLAAAALLLALIPLKTALFFWLLTRFRLRARSATLASLALADYSEFGLILTAMAVAAGWLPAGWVTVFALAVALSFVLAAPLNILGSGIYRRWRDGLLTWERDRRLPGDGIIDPGAARVAVFGMGRLGSAAYDSLRERWGDTILGVDRDADTVARHRAQGRRIVRGDAADPDFWSRIDQGRVRYALLTLPDHQANLSAARLCREFDPHIRIAAVARFEDEVAELRTAGAERVFNLYTEAGAGFAEHLWASVESGHRARAPVAPASDGGRIASSRP